MHPTHRTIETQEIESLRQVLVTYQFTNPARYKSSRNLLIFNLMLEAGLRVGECLKLLFSDVYFNSIPVTSIIIRGEIAKTKRERILPVNQKLCEALKNYRKHFALNIIENQRAFLFCSRDFTKTLTVRQVERIISSAGKKALNKTITPHMLRHTFATRLMRVTNIRTVQALLGHVALSSTQIYTHPNGDDFRKAIDAI